jgi:hypothetical protein
MWRKYGGSMKVHLYVLGMSWARLALLLASATGMPLRNADRAHHADRSSSVPFRFRSSNT